MLVYKENNVSKETKYYLGGYEEKTNHTNGITEKIHYLSGAIYIERSNGTSSFYYAYTDYLGSLIALTDESGTVVERYAYDPWGKRRNPTNWTQDDNRTTWIVNRGYTGHEHLDTFGMLNMNGRVYDPMTAMFFSPDPFVQAPDNWLNYNRYAYAYGNPFRYTDPDGEWIHLVVGAVIGGVVNWAMNGAEFSWKGLGYFGIGAAAGALGAGVGAGISSMLPVAGTASGGFAVGFLGTSAATTATSSFVSGALIGGGAGLASGFTSGLGNGLLGGQNFGQALWSGTKNGLIGGLSGSAIGGLWGGIDAAIDGRRFWDGATVQKTTLAQQNIPVVGQRGDNNCLPASAEAIDASFGGNMTQEQIRNLPTLGGDPNTVPLGDVDVWSAYGNASGHTLSGEIPYPSAGSPANVLSNMQSGNRVAINLNTGNVGHSVVMQRVVQQTATKINGTVTQKLLYYVMNPANGGSITRISSRSIINAYNIFYILP